MKMIFFISFIIFSIYAVLISEGAVFNTAFASSVQANILNTMAIPWEGALDTLATIFNSGESCAYSGLNSSSTQTVDLNQTRAAIWSVVKKPLSDKRYLDWVYVGFENGMFVGYGLNQLYSQKNQGSDWVSYVNKTDEVTGKPSGPATGFYKFECTSRPWYQTALQHGDVWSQPYVSVGSYGLTITAARRVMTNFGHVLGVFGADYRTLTIDRILASLLIENDDYLAFIVDNQGMLISASIAGVAVIDDVQIDAASCSNIVVKDVSCLIRTYATSQHSGWEVVEGMVLTVEVQGLGLIWAQSSPVRDSKGLDWHVVLTEVVSCDKGYFPAIKSKECNICPNGGICLGGNFMPYPKVGYWLDRQHDIESRGIVYQCDSNSCSGFDLDRFNERLSCWKSSSYNDSICNPNLLMCSKGSFGPLCGSCLPSYTFTTSSRSCVLCDGAANIGPQIFVLCCVITVVVFGGMKIFVAMSSSFAFQPRFKFGHWFEFFLRFPPIAILMKIDYGILKIIWTSAQIISSMSINISIDYPEPFSSSVSSLSFLHLDFLSVKCLYPETSSFLTNVYVISFVPLFLTIGSVVVFVARCSLPFFFSTEHSDQRLSLFSMASVLISQNKDVHEMFGYDDRLQRVSSQHINFVIVMSYLFLPTVAMAQLSALRCLQVGEHFYLRVDTSIDCNSPSYKNFLIVDGLLIVVYQSIPIMWAVALFRERLKLNPKAPFSNVVADRSTHDSAEDISDSPVTLNRETDRTITYLSFLWKDYRPSGMYFEVIDMYRRIFFIAVIPLVGVSNSVEITLGCIIGVLWAAYVREAVPFIRNSTNIFMNIASYQIFFTYFISLLLVTSALNSLPLSQLALGGLLLGANLVIIMLASYWNFTRWRQEQEILKWRRVLSDEEVAILDEFMKSTSELSDPQYLASTARRKLSSEPAIELTRNSVDDSEHGSHHILKEYLLDPEKVVLSKKIGEGAFGMVFKGDVMGEPVAVKTMREVNPDSVKSFRKEILLTASIRHPNIVNFVGACWGRELICLVLEWVSKGTLESFLDDKRNILRWQDPLLKIAGDTARGMSFLHGSEPKEADQKLNAPCILHRDLKSSNVLISEFLTAKIADFGTSAVKRDVTMTSLGTPLFAAPEIMRGDVYNEKLDVYSFGMLLLDVTVEQPLLEFIGSKWRIHIGKPNGVISPMKLIREMNENQWRPLNSDGMDGAPKTIVQLITRCLAHNPVDRPSFSEILRFLESEVANEIRNGRIIDRAPFGRIPRISSQSTALSRPLPISENVHSDAHAPTLPKTVFDSMLPVVLPEKSQLHSDDWGSFPESPEHIQEFWQGHQKGERLSQLNPIIPSLTEV